MLAELLTAVALVAPAGEAPHIDPPPKHHQFGTIVIPALDEKEQIRVGTTLKELDIAVGHLNGYSWPGQPGLTPLWGHRVTPVNGRPWGPFRWIDKLRPRDRVTVKMPYGRYDYRVTKWGTTCDKTLKREQNQVGPGCVVGANDWTLFPKLHTGPEYATISACTPPGSASYRLVIRLEPDGASSLS